MNASVLKGLAQPWFCAVVVLATAVSVPAADSALDKLQGTWSAKRTSANGQDLQQTLEIQGNKLIYKLANADNELRLFAKGTVKLETLGPFSVLKLSEIQAGRSADDTQAVDEDRTSIYRLGEDTLTLASNFDRDRDNQKPALDVYTRIAGPKAGAAAGSAEKLAGKWKMKLKMGENDRDYDLNIEKADGGLAATLISSRSGEHKFKTVTLTEGKLVMELVRDIQGNEAVFVYTGELKGTELSGTFVVKGFEDQYKGTWSAQR